MFGRTPLHLAVEEGHIEVAERLLALGADSCIEDRDGMAVLHYAAQNSNAGLAMCQLLLENGASKTAITDDGWIPSELAFQEGYMDRLLLIEDFGDFAYLHSALSPDSPPWTLDVRLLKLSARHSTRIPYVTVYFAGHTKTLYLADSIPEAQYGRQYVQFPIPNPCLYVNPNPNRISGDRHGRLEIKMHGTTHDDEPAKWDIQILAPSRRVARNQLSLGSSASSGAELPDAGSSAPALEITISPALEPHEEGTGFLPPSITLVRRDSEPGLTFDVSYAVNEIQDPLSSTLNQRSCFEIIGHFAGRISKLFVPRRRS
ncbi:hypothetical protein BJX64DRAFT_293274 [Aspergillus heterothallicus]